VRHIKFRSGLILVVVAALVPVSILSAVQVLAELDYTRSLLGSKLVISALATADQQRDQIIIARRTLQTIIQIREVRNMSVGCNEGLKTGFAGHTSLLNSAQSDA
jgi:hypothetical protein